MTINHLEGAPGVSAVRQKVEEIWNDVLGAADGQPGATFFELRGESIAAVRLVSRVEDELGILVDVADIFDEDPDLDAFVRQVESRAESPA